MLILKGIPLKDRFIKIVLDIPQLIFKQFDTFCLIFILTNEDIQRFRYAFVLILTFKAFFLQFFSLLA